MKKKKKESKKITARNTNPARKTQSRNISTTQNTKPKHKHSPKHKVKTPKIEKRGRNGSGWWPSVGQQRWVYGGWAHVDQ